MEAVAVTLKQANAFVAKHHRHSAPVRGHKWSVGVAVRGELVGVAIVGRSVARRLDDGRQMEILRVCVRDGVSDLWVCSNLYGRCVRVARDLGYAVILTYTKKGESGASLRAAGFEPVADSPGGTWDVPTRRRTVRETTLFGVVEKKRDTGPKIRWERLLKPRG